MNDFRQLGPQHYLEQDRLHNRWLHGSGTVQGLFVTAYGSLIHVTPGLAVDAAGRVLRVESLHEGSLQGWLDRRNRDTKLPLPADNAGYVTLYVTLGAVGSATGWRPMGAPAPDPAPVGHRPETSSLRFAEAPPRQETDILDALLARIRPTDGPGNLDEERAIRLITGREPLGPDSLLLNRDQAEALLRALLHAWMTQVRPAAATGADDGVLLASVRFRARDGRAEDLTVAMDGRPLLAPVRLLHDWLLRLGLAPADRVVPAPVDPTVLRRTDPVAGDLTGPAASPAVRALQGRALDEAEPFDHAVLTWSGQRQLWHPAPLRPTAPALTITRLRERGRTLHEVWFHIPGETAVTVKVPPALTIYTEGDREWRQLWEGALTPAGRNRFTAPVPARLEGYRHLHFAMRLGGARTQDGRLLADVARTGPFHWTGFDGHETIHMPFFSDPALAAFASAPWDETAAGEEPRPPRKRRGLLVRFFRWFFGFED